MGEKLEPCGVVALLTDFGLDDPFVGVMKGVILRRFPGARIVDLTHQIRPQDITEGAFWLSRSYPWFPTGTVHVAVVDPGVGTERRALAARVDGQLFVAPDNGIMAGVLDRAPQVEVRELDLGRFDLPQPSATFHGRDVFAPVAAELASGRRRLEQVGPPVDEVVRLDGAGVRTVEAGLEGRVVSIDHFGNLITNISAIDLSAARTPRGHLEVWLGPHRIGPLRTAYAEVGDGEPVALIGSAQMLEIAVNRGNSAQVFGAARGTQVSLR